MVDNKEGALECKIAHSIAYVLKEPQSHIVNTSVQSGNMVVDKV